MALAPLLIVEGVSIGNRVLLGGGVKIMDSDANCLDYEKRCKGHQLDITAVSY